MLDQVQLAVLPLTPLSAPTRKFASAMPAVKASRLACHAFGRVRTFSRRGSRTRNQWEVRKLLSWAEQHDVVVIPYGGGTSVAGHINPQPSSKPVLTLSLARMNRLVELDRESQIATFGAGTPGPQVEQQLREQGYV